MNWVAVYMLLMFNGTYELGTEGMRYFDTKEECTEWVLSDMNREMMVFNYKDKDVERVTPICLVNTRETDLVVNYVKTGI
ncbi:uncharacterized protein METZ01_LOCUS315192 [marine metagenome]|uniref:Uncharacterized protein n=1 Tax=marine metagenome TaxID=408172 RepID=A0A382NPC2_9ZZZZ